MREPWKERLKRLRLHAKLTQKELASRMGVNRSLIAQVERGTSGLSLENLDAWLGACGFEFTAIQMSPDKAGDTLWFAQFVDQASPGLIEKVKSMLREFELDLP